MSRVEPKSDELPKREADRRREPEKAEGDEETIDEALRRQAPSAWRLTPNA